MFPRRISACYPPCYAAIRHRPPPVSFGLMHVKARSLRTVLSFLASFGQATIGAETFNFLEGAFPFYRGARFGKQAVPLNRRDQNRDRRAINRGATACSGHTEARR